MVSLDNLEGLRAFAATKGAQRAAPGRNQAQAMLDRALLKLLKTLRQVQEVHPW